VVRLLPLRHRGEPGFNQAFFPDQSTFVGTLLSFATFAVGFVVRPIGGSSPR
jgi:hypothetical protein